MTKPNIIFIFNQLQTDQIYTGGETRSKKILDYFHKSKNFKVRALIPKISSPNFKKYKKIIVGDNLIEKILSKPTILASLILYFTRTIETLFLIKKLKNKIIYTTGDFYCNTLPVFLTKLIYPKTIWVSWVYHINLNPFQRKSNSFFASTASYLFQRFSLLLIRQKSDAIFLLNPQVKKYLKDHKFDTNKIHIIGTGLDINSVKKQIRSVKYSNLKNEISYFGRLSPTKGCLDLPLILKNIKKKHPNIVLNLIGQTSPQFKTKLKNAFKKSDNLSNVRFYGFIPDKSDVYKILLTSKLIIFPSYEEGWGISLFESIMTKRPILTYDLDVFKYIFKNNLMMSPIGNIKDISQKATNILCQKNKQKIVKSIKACYKIATKYDWKSIYKTELKNIQKLTSGQFIN